MLWWTDDLKTGVESIDRQHKSIFEKASKILELDMETDFEEIEKAFIFLMGYTNNHFYEEELLMMENKYINFVQHRNEHNYFVEEIYKLYLKTLDGSISENTLANLKLLVIDWLVNHINKSDREFAETIKDKY